MFKAWTYVITLPSSHEFFVFFLEFLMETLGLFWCYIYTNTQNQGPTNILIGYSHKFSIQVQSEGKLKRLSLPEVLAVFSAGFLFVCIPKQIKISKSCNNNKKSFQQIFFPVLSCINIITMREYFTQFRRYESLLCIIKYKSFNF